MDQYWTYLDIGAQQAVIVSMVLFHHHFPLSPPYMFTLFSPGGVKKKNGHFSAVQKIELFENFLWRRVPPPCTCMNDSLSSLSRSFLKMHPNVEWLKVPIPITVLLKFVVG